MTIDEAIKRLKLTDACDIELCEALDMAIKALEQEQCEDCISREAVENVIKYAEINFTVNSDIDFTKHKREVQEIVNGIVDAQIKALRDLPSVTPQPKMGRWIDIMVGDMPAQACDQCNTFYPLAYTGGGHKYCPNCGAKMQEVNNE